MFCVVVDLNSGPIAFLTSDKPWSYFPIPCFWIYYMTTFKWKLSSGLCLSLYYGSSTVIDHIYLSLQNQYCIYVSSHFSHSNFSHVFTLIPDQSCDLFSVFIVMYISIYNVLSPSSVSCVCVKDQPILIE